MQEFTYTLKHPVELKNKETGEVIEKITSVTLKRPKAPQLRAMDAHKGEVGKTIALVGACAGLPPSTIDQLDGEDLLVLMEKAADFFPASLLTGAKSSQT